MAAVLGSTLHGPTGALPPPPYAPVGSLHQVGAGALRGPYAAPVLITSLGGCNEGDLPRNPLREEGTETLDVRGRHPCPVSRCAICAVRLRRRPRRRRRAVGEVGPVPSP